MGKQNIIKICASTLIIGLIVSLIIANEYCPEYKNALEEQRISSGKVVLAKDGRILRVIPRADDTYQVWVSLDRIPPLVRRAFIAAEDKRFHQHPGFDPIAMVRALISNIYYGRIVSGASTITQQVVRLIEPRPRTYLSKLIEFVSAIKMELQLTKGEILELYLNMTPTGGNIRGVKLASKMYFGKSLSGLTAPEAAFMAVMPRSPTKLDPRREGGRVRAGKAKDLNLRLMAQAGWIENNRLQELLGGSIKYNFSSFPMEAPHLVDHLISKPGNSGSVVRTFLDLDLQRTAEKIVNSHKNRLAKLGVGQVAMIIVSAKDGEVLSFVGSMKYGPEADGYNNGVLAKRSAGSTLKPFLYGLAIEKGFNAVSRVSDTLRTYPTPYGDYMPFNADRRSYGPVSMRTALGNSLNLSAVKVLGRIGLEDFYANLDKLQLVMDKSKKPDHYGLGMAIGNMEVSLERLAQAYLTLANNGVFKGIKYTDKDKVNPTKIYDPSTTFIINRILSDPTARMLTFGNPETLAFGFPVCVKTGTSANYRDCWIVGYTPEKIVAIWAGNFDGSPNYGVTGIRVCGPILKDVIKHFYGTGEAPKFQKPDEVTEQWICWISGLKAKKGCKYKYKEILRTSSAQSLQTCNIEHSQEPRIILGSPYAKWLHDRELNLSAGRFRLGSVHAGSLSQPEISGGLTPIRPKPGRVNIISPHNGDRFVVSGASNTKIRLRALVNPLTDHLRWYVNGMEVGKTPSPYELLWTPVRGAHSIIAATPDGAADGVRIIVE